MNLWDLGNHIHLRSHTTDISVLAELIVQRGYDCVLPHLDAPPSRVLDLGANIGLASRWMLAQWADASIAAVEPAAENLTVLRRNLAPYRKRTHIVEGCIGGASGPAAIATTGGAWEYRMSNHEGGGENVRVMTIHDLLQELDWSEIDLLKCDIEGAEAEVFALSAPWIDRVRLAVVECHGDYSGQDLLADVRRNGGRFEIVYASEKSAFNCSVVVLRRTSSSGAKE